MQIRLQETIRVHRGLADCFRYVKDFSTIEQWDPGVYRSSKRTPGSVSKGCVFDLLLNVNGNRVPMVYTLEDIKEGEYLLLEGVGEGLRAVDRISFKAISPDQTEIEYVADLTLEKLPELIRPLLMPAMKRLGVKAVSGLQRALDIPSRAPAKSCLTAAKDRLVLPAALDFTERGYLKMARKGLSEFMDDQVVVITGPTSGLGLAAACELSRLGANLVLVGRDQDRLEQSRRDILAFSGADEQSLEVYEAELSLVSEVRRVARDIMANHDGIDVLINNAGALPLERMETAEGNELALAINLIAPYELTTQLLPLLLKRKGRVINVASGGMYLQPLRLDDMQFTQGTYDGAKAYARAKRGLVAVTEHLSHLYRPYGVDFHAMHPGWAATPGVAKSLPSFNDKLEKRLRDARMGADTMVWLASASEVDGVTGKFWFDRQPHTTAVLPGTRVESREVLELMAWLSGEAGTTPPLAQLEAV